MKKVNSTRFGELETQDSEIITFPESLAGFTEKSFTLFDPGDATCILWLQCLDNGALAFPVIKASDIFPGYKDSLGFTSKDEVYLILTIPNDVTQMTMNTRAPISINTSTREGKQVLMTDSKDLVFNRPAYKDIKELIIKKEKSA